ncbi:nucleoside diphosphate-linked moiety X motif 17 [Dendropsophus ebraccatus]|uniref:nucleoside diphosphate-linked moiety X motif 17 n=1 Tax=Dendropsophus ebraccatus TaxID=150705 RepID=UPI003831D82E
MESAKRVLVYLRKETSVLQCAKFVQGITGHYAPGSQDRAMVNCGLDHNRFIISDRPFSGSRRAELQRPDFCPIKNLTDDQVGSLPEEIRGRGVDVGVAILLQSVNRRILLTRRSKELHIFPNVWVPPGGHMEEGEQLLDAGLRELQEETGLNLQGANLPWSILGLWESAFPPLMSRGLPRRHHIVAYLLVRSNETHQELQEKLRPDEQEVSACTWLDPEVTERIVAAKDGVKDSGRKSPELQTSIMITEVRGQSLIQKDLAVRTLLNTVPVDGEDTERVSTGTKYALSLWLETLRREEEVT